VAWVGDGRPATGLAGHIIHGVGVADHPQLVRVAGVVELRVGRRPPPVDGVEVVARGAEVDDRIRIGLLLVERGGVEGDVVVDELAEEGHAGGELRVGVIVGRVVGVERLRLSTERLLLHLGAEVEQQRVGGSEGGQSLEHEAEPTLGRPVPHRQGHPAQLGAVRRHRPRRGRRRPRRLRRGGEAGCCRGDGAGRRFRRATEEAPPAHPAMVVRHRYPPLHRLASRPP
jgi:hypothetical protein